MIVPEHEPIVEALLADNAAFQADLSEYQRLLRVALAACESWADVCAELKGQRDVYRAAFEDLNGVVSTLLDIARLPEVDR